MQNRRILVVDDNSSLHEDFRKILLGNNNLVDEEISNLEKDVFSEGVKTTGPNIEYEVDFASQGEEALRKVVDAQERSKPYAVVFMDVRMPPGWDGIATIAKIWEKHPDTEMVVCTAYSDYS